MGCERSTILILLRAKCFLVCGVLDWSRDRRVKGWGLGKDQMMLVQEGPSEVVDWPNGTERHGIVSPPKQVRTKHHSQVTVGHLIHFAVSRYLTTQTRKYYHC